MNKILDTKRIVGMEKLSKIATDFVLASYLEGVEDIRNREDNIN
jgi:hypothetical protein